MQELIFVPVEKIHEIIKEVFEKMGYPEEQAKVSADVLVASDLKGITTHGVQRLKYYYDRVVTKRHLADTTMEIVKDNDGTAVIDGKHGNGHFISKTSMQMAIDKAKKYGVGMVVVRESTHYGIAGYFTEMATQQGCIGITGTNTRPSVVPTFGVEPILGTNPLTFGIPTDEAFPFNLDCATSIVQRGKVEEYAREEKPMVEGAIIDSKTGEFRTDAKQLLIDFVEDKAALLPLGGKGEELGGYKGYGYSMVVEILSAALQDGKFLKELSGLAKEGEATHFHLGHFFIAIDIEHFIELNLFKKIAGTICRQVRETKKEPGQERIYTAGEKEYLVEQRVRKEGVPIKKSIQEDLIFLKEKLGIEINLGIE
jgi:LDH2 family malate/lactate/ureidoglycolate dehydrogenase